MIMVFPIEDNSKVYNSCYNLPDIRKTETVKSLTLRVKMKDKNETYFRRLQMLYSIFVISYNNFSYQQHSNPQKIAYTNTYLYTWR